MNNKVRLLVHGVTVEEWTKRYGVTPFTHPCYGCGHPLTTTIPFVQGQLRGLQAPKCECGEHDSGYSHPPYSIVRDPKYGDLFDNWGK